MNEKIMFQGVRELCCQCGIAIDRIAQKSGIRQDLVAKMFLETMKEILNRIEGEA